MKYKHMEGDGWESKGKDGQMNWRWRREKKVKGMRRKFHGQKRLGIMIIPLLLAPLSSLHTAQISFCVIYETVLHFLT
jgi:hypothetical protein